MMIVMVVRRKLMLDDGHDYDYDDEDYHDDDDDHFYNDEDNHDDHNCYDHNDDGISC